jgi:hypothetical protein
MTVGLLMLAWLPWWQQILQPLSMAQQYPHTPSLVVGVLDICLATAFVAFSRAAPDFRVFRKTGAYYAAVGVEQLWQYHGGLGSGWVLRVAGIYLLVEMAAEAMEIPRHRWTMALIPVYVVTLVLGWFPQFAYVQEWPVPASALALAILIVQGFLSGSPRGRLIAAAVTVHFFARLTVLQTVQRTLGIKGYIPVGSWEWSYVSISQTILGLLTLTVFVRALVTDRAEKQRMSRELAAARAVQQVMIPETAPSTPGFEIQSVYRPYGELGGDFFQIIPNNDGSLLVAIGDVSGKGIPAAMMVSLVVGTLHTLAETMSRPGELLSGLNRRVLGRSAGGFTTCLLFRVEPDGRLTFASAGHLAPYMEGREVAIENGFPLGLVEDMDYPETEAQLAIGATLTLVTDGVVEARDGAGELFGFPRTERISTRSAEGIVKLAQDFGQDDDITAVTVKRIS